MERLLNLTSSLNFADQVNLDGFQHLTETLSDCPMVVSSNTVDGSLSEFLYNNLLEILQLFSTNGQQTNFEF